MLQTVMPLMADKEFEDNLAARSSKVLYAFNTSETEEIEAFRTNLDESLGKLTHFELNTSVDVYDEKTIFVVVHGFNSINGALGFSDILTSNKLTIDKEYIAISSPNYQIIQVHKNLQDYVESQ